MAKRTTSSSTALAKWDEELARQAEAAAKMEESVASGQFFGLQGGILTWQDAPLPNNEMAAIIVDHVLENVYYEGAFDPSTPQSPICFAFGRDDKTMAPHAKVVEAGNSMAGASGLCAGCEMNEWGSAETGRGKACRNVRRLALIPAGELKDGKFSPISDPNHFKNASIGFMKVPVTSVKGYASFVKQVAGALKRPPHGIVTKIKLVPDPQNQFRVLFEPLVPLPNELLGVVMERHEEAMSVIDFPYLPPDDTPVPAKAKGGARGRAAAPARGRTVKPAARGNRKY